MHTFGLVILAFVGVALTVGLPVALFLSLPASILQRAGGFGRFAGLGTHDRSDQTPSGRAAVSGFSALLGQPV